MIIIGADHGGFELKEKMKDNLCRKGLTVVDVGAYSLDNEDDFSKFVKLMCNAFDNANQKKQPNEENQEINNLSTISISNSEEIENTIQKNEIQSNSSSTTNHQTSTQNKSISLDSIRELHEANHRESMLFDQAHSTPSQHLLYSSSILLPQSVVKRLRTEDLKYTEADIVTVCLRCW